MAGAKRPAPPVPIVSHQPARAAERVASAAVVPPAPAPKLFSFAWTNAPGACLSHVWSNRSPVPIATVTNLPTGMPIVNVFTVTNRHELETFRVSHPVQIGHYWDTGVWRVNPKVLGM